MVGNSWGTGTRAARGRSLEIEEPVVKLQSACFEKLIFWNVFNVRKTKRIAKFDGLEPRRREDVKEIVALEMGLKSFETFETGPRAQLFESRLT